MNRFTQIWQRYHLERWGLLFIILLLLALPLPQVPSPRKEIGYQFTFVLIYTDVHVDYISQ